MMKKKNPILRYKPWISASKVLQPEQPPSLQKSRKLGSMACNHSVWIFKKPESHSYDSGNIFKQ
jgi:hypothetical protein